MSGDPQLCASLVSDGLADKSDGEPTSKTKLYAISSRFDLGFERVKRFTAIVRTLIAQAPAPTSPPAVGILRRIFAPQRAATLAASTVKPASVAHLSGWLDETIKFLESHRDQYLLLETIELDIMSESEESKLRACVEEEIARCLHAGAAVDALSVDIAEAGRQLKLATTQEQASPMNAFFELHLDDDCDSSRDGTTKYPIGLQWDESLYFGLWNRAEFEAQRT
jgi:hypothetical protein